MLGLPHGDGAEAARFVRAWHGTGEELVGVSLAGSQAKRLTTLFATTAELAEMFESGDIDDLCYWRGSAHNIYHSAGYVRERLEPTRRGGKTNVLGLPGVWLDLDVKPGSFYSEGGILAWLDTLPLTPTITVATGSGGVQAYWKTDQVLDPWGGEQLGLAWWKLCQDRCDVAVDKLQNVDRILRTPGSIRWPKAEEAATRARVIWLDGPIASAERLAELTAEVRERAHRQQLESRQHYVDQGARAMEVALEEIGDDPNRWTLWQLVARDTEGSGVENMFNEAYGWRDILGPHGWSELGEDYDGRTLWMRPGGTRKSAATDYVDENGEVSHVMSLFSDAAETGLAQLSRAEEAKVALTKYRVNIELNWGGDEVAYVRAFVRAMRRGEGIPLCPS